MNLSSTRSYLKDKYDQYSKELVRISHTLYETIRIPKKSFTVEEYRDSLQLFMGENGVIKEKYRDYINIQVKTYATHGHLFAKREGKRFRYTTRTKTTLPPFKGELLELPFRIPYITKPAPRKKRTT